MTHDFRRGVLWALAAAAMIGLFSIPWKEANAAGSTLVSALVLLLSAAIFSTLLAIRQQGRLPRFRRLDVVVATGLAVLTLAGNLSSAVAIQSLQPSILTVVMRSEVILVALLAWPLIGERVDARFWLGAGVAGLGLLVLRDPFSAADARFVGMVWAVAASLCFAVMAVITRRVIHDIDPVAVNGLRLWLSVAMWFVMNGVPDVLLEAPARQVGWAVLAAFVGPFAGRICMMMSSRHLEARLTTLMTLAAPPITLVVAYLWLGDWPADREIAGGALMLVGIAIPVLWRGPRSGGNRPVASSASPRSYRTDTTRDDGSTT